MGLSWSSISPPHDARDPCENFKHERSARESKPRIQPLQLLVVTGIGIPHVYGEIPLRLNNSHAWIIKIVLNELLRIRREGPPVTWPQDRNRNAGHNDEEDCRGPSPTIELPWIAERNPREEGVTSDAALRSSPVLDRSPSRAVAWFCSDRTPSPNTRDASSAMSSFSTAGYLPLPLPFDSLTVVRGFRATVAFVT